MVDAEDDGNSERHGAMTASTLPLHGGWSAARRHAQRGKRAAVVAIQMWFDCGDTINKNDNDNSYPYPLAAMATRTFYSCLALAMKRNYSPGVFKNSNLD